MKSTVEPAELLKNALRAMANAYAPYSKFHVGAAVIDENGRVFSGCNFENSSYSATICAERNAIGAMIAAGGRGFSEILIVTDTPNGCPPCGVCRQVLAEFAKNPSEAKVHVANTKGIVKTFTFHELLPEAFNACYLKP